MKQSFGRSSPAILVVFVAVLVVAGCGQVTDRDAASVAEPRARAPAQLVQADFCDDAESPDCAPTGAHGALAVNFATGHAGYECKECHYIGGRLAFKPASKGGLAFLPAPSPRPSFDAGNKTCSNIACHGVPPGTFSYYFPGNEMDADGYPIPELKTVNFGGTTGAPTPPWYTTGASCAACHGNPPVNGSDGSNAWHSGSHANNTFAGSNDCELCHNDPTTVGANYIPIAFSAIAGDGLVRGYAINPLARSHHATSTGGAMVIKARFRSSCFGCH